MMKKKLFFLLLSISMLIGVGDRLYAQVVSINNVPGTKIRNTDGYEGIEGSPYFNKDWLSGQVVLVSGKEAKMDYLRYDMLEDKLFFSDEGKQAEFAFAEPVRAFTIRGAVFQNNFPSIGDFTAANYYQVIGKGKFSLLKKEANTIGERTAYGTPAIRYFKKNTKYYIYDGKKMAIVKTDSKSLAEALGVKKEDIEKYAKENKLDLKNDAELKTVFENFSK